VGTFYFVLGISRVKVCGTGKGRGDGKMAVVTPKFVRWSPGI